MSLTPSKGGNLQITRLFTEARISKPETYRNRLDSCFHHCRQISLNVFRANQCEVLSKDLFFSEMKTPHEKNASAYGGCFSTHIIGARKQFY